MLLQMEVLEVEKSKSLRKMINGSVKINIALSPTSILKAAIVTRKKTAKIHWQQ